MSYAERLYALEGAGGPLVEATHALEAYAGVGGAAKSMRPGKD